MVAHLGAPCQRHDDGNGQGEGEGGAVEMFHARGNCSTIVPRLFHAREPRGVGHPTPTRVCIYIHRPHIFS